MYELFHAIYTGQNNVKLEELIDIVSRAKGLNSQAVTTKTLVVEEFKNFAEDEVQRFTQKHGDTLFTHWNMLKRSGFKPDLWRKFKDVNKFSESIVNNYIAELFAQFTVKQS